MSTILDQFGNPWVTQRFTRALNSDPYRGLRQANANQGIERLIPGGDRRALAALSRRLVFNVGIPKEAVRQKASFSVGQAWRPTYLGDDQARGTRVAAWLENEWFHMPDVRGQSDWWEMLELVSKSMDRDGEHFAILTEGDAGWPQIQHLPAHLVRSEPGDEVVKGGKFDGAPINDGVIFDPVGRPLAYRVYDADGKDYRDLPAANVLHTYDRDFSEQLRGYPAFAASLKDILHGLESRELELLRQIVVSSIYLLEKGGPAPDPNDPSWESLIDTTNQEAVLYEQVAPGVRHLKAGAEIEAVTHTNPGSAWESFQTRIHREAVVGMGWSYALVRVSNDAMQGTAERAEVVRARLAIKNRQRALRKFAIRVISWVTAKAQAGRLIRRAPDTDRWSFSVPERLTVDDGREDRCQLEAVLKGTASLSSYLANKGLTAREHYMELAEDYLEAQAVSAAKGVPVEQLQTAREAGELDEIILEDD